jgi:hypothetical protein
VQALPGTTRAFRDGGLVGALVVDLEVVVGAVAEELGAAGTGIG